MSSEQKIKTSYGIRDNQSRGKVSEFLAEKVPEGSQLSVARTIWAGRAGLSANNGVSADIESEYPR